METNEPTHIKYAKSVILAGVNNYKKPPPPGFGKFPENKCFKRLKSFLEFFAKYQSNFAFPYLSVK